MLNKINIVCFIGHRKIEITEKLIKSLKVIIEYLIVYKNVQIFLFGSKSEFDDLCVDIVKGLKEKYSFIKLIYVRAEYPYIDEEYSNYLLKTFDETYFPEKLLKAGSSVYVERNYQMIDKSDFCVFYYDESYLPLKRKRSKKSLTNYQPSSGTKLAFENARKKNKNIINLLGCLPEHNLEKLFLS